jgi:hypothetical protein
MKKTMIIVITMCLFIACSKTSPAESFTPDCGASLKSFATDVAPIIQSSCASNAGCHSAGSNNGPGELLRYSQVFGAKSIIRAAVISGRMPLNSSLSSAQKNAIICWIDNGAPEN